MRQTVRLGRFAGIPAGVHWSVLDGEAPHARGDLLIALVGPLVSLAAAGAFAAGAAGAHAWGAGSLTVASLSWLAVVNAIIGGFNLLPGAPLDGGRVLAAALWWKSGDRAAARRTAGRVGVLMGGLLMGFGLLEVFLTATFGGLWLVLLGWFLSSAARAEATDAGLRSALAGVRVADAMTTPAVCGYASQTISSFVTGVACRHPYRIFPVLDLNGRLTGLVSLTRLGRVPAAERERVRLADVQAPLDRVRVLDTATPLVDAAPALLAGGHRLAPVVTGGQLTGVITAGDVARAVELATLGVAARRSDQDATAGPAHGAGSGDLRP